MRHCILLFSFIALLSSCGIYSYRYNEKKDIIISSKGKYISLVMISDSVGMMMGGKILASFHAIDGKPSDKFSLTDFSPYNFKGDPFRFEKNKTYHIKVLPMGDRMLEDIVIRVDENGNKKNSTENN